MSTSKPRKPAKQAAQPLRRKPPDEIAPASAERAELRALLRDSRRYNRDRLTVELLDYIDQTALPILAEFALVVGVEPSYLRATAKNHPPLNRAVELCMAKKEAALEQGGLVGAYAPAVTIFSLKQLGWKDTQAHELTGKDGGPIEMKKEADELSDAELAAIASTGRAASAEPETSED